MLPKGVANVVTGKGSKAGEYLKTHDGIDKIAFTGSTEIGRDIAIVAAENIIPVMLELSGKSANIIYADADFDVALDGVQIGIYLIKGKFAARVREFSSKRAYTINLSPQWWRNLKISRSVIR